MSILEFAVKLHSINTNWVVFFREILGPDGLVYKTYPNQTDREKFEESTDYFEILKMLEDLIDLDIKDRNEEVRELKLRLPISLHDYLKLKAKDEGFTTLSGFVTRKLLKGCFNKKIIETSCPNGVEDWQNCNNNCGDPLCPRMTQEEGTDGETFAWMAGDCHYIDCYRDSSNSD